MKTPSKKSYEVMLVAFNPEELAHFRNTVPVRRRSYAIRRAMIEAGLIPSDFLKEKQPSKAS